MGLIRDESKRDKVQHSKHNRIEPDIETRRQFSNTTWTSSVCSLIPWSQCDGPKTNISKDWNAGGMVEKCNGRGWNGGQWTPK